MEGPPEERALKVEDLYSLLREIERRVAALEQARLPGASPLEDAAPRQVLVPAAAGVELAVPALPGGIIPVLGRALLGIAGAYLLRAAAESGTIPQWAAVLAAVIYAACWLVSSSRVVPGNRFTVAVYSLTAALILSPLLWETTVRFQVLRPSVTATVLALFAGLAAVLAWRRDAATIPWVTTIATAATAMALITATRDVLPFTAALLAIAVVVEYAACRDHWLGERWVVALAADFSVFLLTYLVTRPHGMPEGYAPVTPGLVLAVQMLLLSVYLGSTVYRTLIHGLKITGFEIGQAVMAFLISVGGALEVTDRAAAARFATGGFLLLASAACYLAVFSLLDGKKDRARNFHIYSGFALALALSAPYLVLSGAGLAATWCVSAAITMAVSIRASRASLRVHSLVYLAAAIAGSGLIGFGYDRISGSASEWGPPSAGVAITMATAALCYGMARRNDGPAARFAALFTVSVVCWSILSLIAGPAAAAGAPMAATIRTASICLLSALLAWMGPHWSRPELLRLVYPLMIGGAVKLVAQDFQQGNAVSMCISLLFFGGALIVIPRLARSARKGTGHEVPLKALWAHARRTT